MSTELEKAMIEATDLAIPEGSLIPNFNVHDDKTFAALAAGAGYFPRIQLFGGNTDAAKEGKIPMNHYGLVPNKDTLIDLGKEVDVLVVCYRPKALDMSDRENIVAIHDPAKPEFQEISERSFVQDSGCSFGPEFLIYVPSQEKFATIHFGSKSSRREAPQMKALIGKAATLKSKLASNASFKWQAIVVTACSTPFKIPPVTDIADAAERFNTEKDTTPAAKADAETTGAGRAR